MIHASNGLLQPVFQMLNVVGDHTLILWISQMRDRHAALWSSHRLRCRLLDAVVVRTQISDSP